MPELGETLHMVVSVSYRTVDLIPAWLALKAPEPITELYIATLSFNRGCLDLILELIHHGDVQRFAFVVSTFSKNLETAMTKSGRSRNPRWRTPSPTKSSSTGKTTCEHTRSHYRATPRQGGEKKG